MPFKKGYTPWNKGKRETVFRNGYVMVYFPEHENSMSDGYIYQHRLVMESHLGRLLESDEHIHPIDGDKKNNNINNLQITTNSSHQKEEKTIHGLHNHPDYHKLQSSWQYARDRDYILKQRVKEAIRKQYDKLEREAQGDNSWLSGLSYLEDLEEELGL